MLNTAVESKDVNMVDEIMVDSDTLEILELSKDFFTSTTKDVIKAKDFVYELSLRRTDFSTDKEMISFVKNVEKLVRGCNEYKLWLEYLRESLRLETCQITGENTEFVTIEVHHYPLTLFSLCKAITMEKMSLNEEFSSFDIALEVMSLHFNMKVGFVLLVKTLHEKFHNGAFNIPIELVHGDYLSTIERFSKFFDEDESKKIKEYLNTNKNNCGWKIKWIESGVLVSI